MTVRARDFELGCVLVEPQRIAGMDNEALGRLISQARISRTLPSLTARLRDEGQLQQLPAPVRRHFESAYLVHQKQRQDLNYDCESIGGALNRAGIKLVLLKGGAYIASELPLGDGRLITDIDIIVPRDQLEKAEQALNDAGWESSQLDPYNESYYRRWSHEVPALVNRKRGTTLDLHHNILPPTAAPDIDADLLFENCREAHPGIYTLGFTDMVIHSATHLFHEGEFHHGLRDLWDLDRMLRDFPERQTDFWPALLKSAQRLELEQPLYHCLNYTTMVFATPVPAEIMAGLNTAPRRLRRPLMDFLFRRAFRPDHPDCRLPLTGLALYLLYIRSHYLRMPLYLLLPHLVRKAWMRRAKESPEALGKSPPKRDGAVKRASS